MLSLFYEFSGKYTILTRSAHMTRTDMQRKNHIFVRDYMSVLKTL